MDSGTPPSALNPRHPMRTHHAFALLAGMCASIAFPPVANGTPDKSPDAGGRSNRIVKFSGGQVAIDADRGTEHLVVTDSAGEVMSESWCDSESGSYDELALLFRRFRESVGTGDVATVAKLARFPTGTPIGRSRTAPSWSGGTGSSSPRPWSMPFARQSRMLFSAEAVRQCSETASRGRIPRRAEWQSMF